MARINGSANGNGNGKYPARTSLGGVSRGYNPNGEDDEIFDETESKWTGHTRNDQKDMSRMGKRQELIVSLHTQAHPFFSLKKSKTFFSALLDPAICSCLFLTKN